MQPPFVCLVTGSPRSIRFPDLPDFLARVSRVSRGGGLPCGRRSCVSSGFWKHQIKAGLSQMRQCQLDTKYLTCLNVRSLLLEHPIFSTM